MKSLNRREFAKLSSFGLMYAFLGAVIGIGTGCPGSLDAVIAALSVAGSVATAASNILRPINSKFADLLTTVSGDLSKVVTLYREYDSAAGDKPTKLQLLQATVSTIVNNLNEIFQAIHVFNPNLRTDITIAIGIINTSISFIISHLPAQHKAAMQAMRLSLPPLPIIDGAKNANDLKAKWNQTVRAEHPEAVIH